MSESLTINGVSLSTYAYLLADISGVMAVPSRRGSNVTVPARDGAIRSPNKRFEPNDLVLKLWINGCLPDGSVPIGSSAQKEFFARRDELLNLLYAPVLTLAYTRPDGTSVSALGEVTEVLDFTRIGIGPEAQVNVAVTLYESFWFDTLAVSQTITGTTGATATLTAFQGATAPMNELTLTFGPCNNPQINHGARFVTFNGVISAGRQLVINTANWTVGYGTGTVWTPDPRLVSFSPGPRWLELDPTVSPFQAEFVHTGGGSATCTVSGRRRYLAA